MKKRVWRLLGAGIIIVLSVAFLCMILQENENIDKEQSYEGTQIIVLKEKKVEELETVRVISAKGEFCASKNQQGHIEIPALNGLPTDQEKIAALCKYACLIRGQQVLEGAQEQPQEYGLDERNSVKVEIEYTDGEEVVFFIGDKVEGLSNDSRYVLFDSTVYTMYELHLAPFLNQTEYYINSELTPSNEEAEYILLYLSIERTDLDKPLTVAYSGTEETTNGRHMATYQITSPEEYAITYNEQGRGYLQSIFGIEAEAEKERPSIEEIAAYGLDKPCIVIKAAYMNREGEDFGIQLAVSDKNDVGEAYLLAEGLDVIYKCNLAEAPWYDITLEDIIGRQICLPDIRTVTHVEVETKEQDLSVDLARNEQEELEVVQYGESVDAEEFKKLYQVLISAEVDEIRKDISNEEVGNCVMEISYEYGDEGKDIISFYEGPSRRMYVFVNGEPYGLIRTTYVDVMQKAVLDFNSGKEIIIRY